MRNTNVAGLRQNLVDFLNQAVQNQEIIQVNTDYGNAVLLGEDEYRGLLETARLISVPGMREKLLDGMNTPTEECDDFEW